MYPLIEQCFHCVDENKTFYQNLFPHSVEEYYCVDNSSEVDFGTTQLYRACDAFQCLLSNVAIYSSASKQKLCTKDNTFMNQYLIPIPWPMLLIFCILIIILPITKGNWDFINRLSRRQMFSRLSTLNRANLDNMRETHRAYTVTV